jgi:hypothetical protein
MIEGPCHWCFLAHGIRGSLDVQFSANVI